MNRFAQICCLWLASLIVMPQAWAQEDGVPFTDRLQVKGGYVFSFLSVEFADVPGSSSALNFNSLMVGTYYDAVQHNDWVSAGVEANLGIGLRVGGDNRLNWQLQAPIFLMGRIGAASTKYNTQSLGLGIGIGPMITHQSIKTTFQNGVVDDITNTWIHPALTVEFVYAGGGAPITFQGTLGLGNATGTYRTTYPDNVQPPESADLNARVFTLGILYSF